MGHSSNGAIVSRSISCSRNAMPFAINNALVTGGRSGKHAGDASTERACYQLHACHALGRRRGRRRSPALRTHGACRLPASRDATPHPRPARRPAAPAHRRCARPRGDGRGAGPDVHRCVRGDATLWLDDPRAGPAARACLAALDTLRIAINRRLFLGLDEVEAHYAAYPPGHRLCETPRSVPRRRCASCRW